MERLTKQLDETIAVYVGEFKQYDTGDIPAELSVPAIREVLLHLAAYENTELTPRQIKDADDFLKENYQLRVDSLVHAYDLLKAEQEGRLKLVKKAPEGERCGNCAEFVRKPGTARGTCRTQHRKRGGRRNELRSVAQSTNACHAFTPREEAEAAPKEV